MLIKKSVVLVIALLLSACGYHLRGGLDLPENFKKVYLEGGSSQLREAFNQTLKASAARLTSTPEQAGIIVRIVGENAKRRALSLSARGRSNEIELYYRLEYELPEPNNTADSHRQLVEIRREYFNDQQDIVAKDNEEAVIQNEMYQQAVSAIINRARFVLKHAN